MIAVVDYGVGNLFSLWTRSNYRHFTFENINNLWQLV